MKQKCQTSMVLQISNSLTLSEMVKNAVAQFMFIMNPTVEEVCDVKLCLAEAFENCAHHAYPNALGPVTIKCVIKGKKNNVLDITVSDEGIGIESITWARVPMNTTGDKNNHAGLGFTIMERYMDGVEVVSAPDEGTNVHMWKEIGK